MKPLYDVHIVGDSLLKGIQVNPDSKRYVIKNDIDFDSVGDELGWVIQNDSRFGCTIEKGTKIIEKMLNRGGSCDIIIMDFGGNDCDYNWKAVSENPSGESRPNVPLPEFEAAYRKLVRRLKEAGIIPVLTTLQPLIPYKFFDWWCKGLDKKSILAHIGDVCNIYSHQENYSRRVEQVAYSEGVPLVDIRGAFLEHGHIEDLICEDGTHPNSKGQQLIRKAFLKMDFSFNNLLTNIRNLKNNKSVNSYHTNA